MRWLPFSVEQELSGNWSVNALRLFLHLLPHMPLKYQVSTIKTCLANSCFWKEALRQEKKKNNHWRQFAAACPQQDCTPVEEDKLECYILSSTSFKG